MSVDFTSRAIEHFKKGVTHDEAKEYEDAYKRYMESIEVFMTAIKYENKNPMKKDLLKTKVREIVNRAEQLKEHLGQQPKNDMDVTNMFEGLSFKSDVKIRCVNQDFSKNDPTMFRDWHTTEEHINSRPDIFELTGTGKSGARMSTRADVTYARLDFGTVPWLQEELYGWQVAAKYSGGGDFCLQDGDGKVLMRMSFPKVDRGIEGIHKRGNFLVGPTGRCQPVAGDTLSVVVQSAKDLRIEKLVLTLYTHSGAVREALGWLAIPKLLKAKGEVQVAQPHAPLLSHVLLASSLTGEAVDLASLFRSAFLDPNHCLPHDVWEEVISYLCITPSQLPAMFCTPASASADHSDEPSPGMTETDPPAFSFLQVYDRYHPTPKEVREEYSRFGRFVHEKPNVPWDRIAGLKAAKDALKEAVILPLRFPQLFTGHRKPWRGILLYGPPGTGKSYLAKAVATEADGTFFTVTGSDLVSKWRGEAERTLKNVFEMAREAHAAEGIPSIIFIDDIDSICSSYGENNRRIMTELLVQMQDVRDGILVLAATNVPWALQGTSTLRRFERRIYIPLPDEEARTVMFKLHLGEALHDLTEADLVELASKTEGYSGSDLHVLVRDATMEPIRALQVATHFKCVVGPDPDDADKQCNERLAPCSADDPTGRPMTLTEMPNPKMLLVSPVTRLDLLQALKRVGPSVNEKDIEQQAQFTADFGQEG